MYHLSDWSSLWTLLNAPQGMYQNFTVGYGGEPPPSK